MVGDNDVMHGWNYVMYGWNTPHIQAVVGFRWFCFLQYANWETQGEITHRNLWFVGDSDTVRLASL